jgi:hypothetical protein
LYKVIMGRMTIGFETLDELDGFLVRHGALPGDDPTWSDKRFPGTPELDREPLTRKTLLLALQLHSLFLSECDDESLQEWTDFVCHHGAELISLALAAVERIEPRRVGVTYQKHTLGAAQQRVVDLLADGVSRTVSEIATALGRNYQNTRHTLPVLEARGLVRRAHDPIKAAQVWSAVAPVAASTEPKPKPALTKKPRKTPVRSPEEKLALTAEQRTQEHIEDMRYIHGWDDSEDRKP